MATYVTMTREGIYGAAYEAASWGQAEALAERDGYDVLDWQDLGQDELILVVAG